MSVPYSAASAARGHSPALRDLTAGAVAAVVTLAITITLGAFGVRPFGPEAASMGIAAGFASAVIGGGLYGWLSRARLPIAGPSSATALVYAGVAAQLAATAAPAPTLWLGLALAVSLAGLAQVLMARFGWARLVRFVPQPVLAGFMNGIALLVLLAQIPTLLALAPGPWTSMPWSQAQWGALALGIGVAAAIWLLQWSAPRVPAALIGLLAGTAAYHLAASWAGLQGLGATVPGAVGAWPAIGVAALVAQPDAWRPLVPLLPALAGQALLLAVIGALDSALSLRALDLRLDERTDESHELEALGWANVAGGVVGALPASIVRARAIAAHQAGGTGRPAAMGAAAAAAVLFALGGPLIGLLPQAVLAGGMLVVGVALADRWSFGLVRRWLRSDGAQASGTRGLRQSLLIVVAVCALTVASGPAAGVAVGVLLSGIAFIRGMNRSLLRARLDAHVRPSRRIYPPAQAQWLAQQRHRIVVLELEGAVFFGSAERLADEAESVAPACRCLVLDLRRIGSVDDSGAMVLGRLHRRLARRGVALKLAHVDLASERHQRLRGAFEGTGLPVGLYDDADLAIEAGEQLLLEEHARETALESHRVHAELNELFTGLQPEQIAVALEAMEPVSLPMGDTLFRQGEPADGVYLVLSGSISIVATAAGSARRQRFVSLSPGTLFGEMAMLDGGGRTVDAIADEDSELLRLGLPALQRLVDEHPPIGVALYRNMARYLAHRLRQASIAWTASSS